MTCKAYFFFIFFLNIFKCHLLNFLPIMFIDGDANCSIFSNRKLYDVLHEKMFTIKSQISLDISTF